MASFIANVDKEQTSLHIPQLSPLIFDMVQEDNSIV